MKRAFIVIFFAFAFLCVITTDGLPVLGTIAFFFKDSGLQKALQKWLLKKVGKFIDKNAYVGKVKEGFMAYFGAREEWVKKSNYDVSVDIDSLKTLFDQEKGWPIYFRDEESLNESLSESNKTIAISFMGVYNRGKTHIMNRLSGHACPAGLLVHTHGVNFMYSRRNESGTKRFVYIDTAGTQQPVSVASIQDRRASESFLQDFVLDIADINVFVVNALTLADQVHMEDVLKYLRNERELKGDMRPVGTNFVVVHNYRALRSKADIEKKIKKDILIIADPVILPQTRHNSHERVYWKEPTTRIRHVVFAQDDSEAGKHYNPIAERLLVQWFEDTNEDMTHGDPYLQKLMDFAQEKLSTYFDVTDDSDTVDMPKVVFASDPPKLTTEHGVKYDYKKDLSFDGNIAVAPSKDKFVPKYDVRGNETHLAFLIDVPGVLPGVGTWDYELCGEHQADGAPVCRNTLNCFFINDGHTFICKSEGLSVRVDLLYTDKLKPRVAFYGNRIREYSSSKNDIRVDRRGYGNFGSRDDFVFLSDHETFKKPRVKWNNGVFEIVLEKQIEDEKNKNEW